MSVATTALRRVLRPGNTGLVLALILTSQLMVVLDATIVNIALPDIKTALGFSPSGLSWVVNAYTLTFGGLLLLGARAGDLLGRRRTFVTGLVIFTVASLLGGFATTPALLLAARAAPGRRWRARLAVRLGSVDDDVPGRARPHPGPGPLHRRLHRWRRRRPDRRGPAHRVRLLALGALRQRPDRRRRHGARAAGAARDRAAHRQVRLRRGDHLDHRHGLARLRLRARRHRRLERAGDRPGLRGRHRPARGVRRHRAPGRATRSRRCGCSPTAAARRRTWLVSCSSPG